MQLNSLIIFENENIVAVDKPHGWLTTPARDAFDTRICLGTDLQKYLNLQIYPVHRLDFEVSGLVLFAKTKHAHRIAQQWFEQRKVVKIYNGLSDAGSEELKDKLQEVSLWKSVLARGKKRAYESPHGLESLTEARLKEIGTHWLWELRPITGRSHQLRFEMAKHGCPLLGDQLYGSNFKSDNKIALRAVELDFSAVSESLSLPQKLSVSPVTWP